MPHVIEPAASGRARCRGCGKPIARGELRFGERLPNPFGDGEMTLWFHVTCGAYTRPEPFLEVLADTAAPLEQRDHLEREARRGVDQRRLPRINGANRAPTARARCRSCRAMIEKGGWRIPLLYYEEGRFEPSGFIHVRCSNAYFDTADVLARLRHFSPDLGEDDLAELGAELAASPPATDQASTDERATAESRADGRRRDEPMAGKRTP
jgi:hypothetical protein